MAPPAHRHAAVLVVGAGPTGLGAAWRLAQGGESDWLLVERGRDPGGLAGSERDAAGFTWDYGGHVGFSRSACYRNLMSELLGPDGWVQHERRASVWLAGGRVPYPIQHHLDRLPATVAMAHTGEGGSADPTPNETPRHFGDWATRTFGAGLTDLFFRPYNEKVWQVPVEQLDWRWIGERVARPRAAATATWGPNAAFRYPSQGGTGAPWRALARRLRATCGDKALFGRGVVAVDLAARVVVLDDGSRIAFDHLVSTMPLDALVAMADDVAPGMRAATARLVHTVTDLVGIGLHGQPPPPVATDHWTYHPGPAVPFYRVSVLSSYSRANVPDPDRTWSLLAESASRPGSSPPARDVVEGTVAALRSVGLVPGTTDICSIWHRRLDHGYPVPTCGRDAVLSSVLPALAARGVWSRGRFGAWLYEVSNQDHSFLQGVEVIDHLRDGQREATLAPYLSSEPRRRP